jgi:hypothetical protein
VLDLNIVANNPDAALTATAQAGQDLRVPVRLCAEHAGRISNTLRRKEDGNSFPKLKTSDFLATSFMNGTNFASWQAVKPIAYVVLIGQLITN